MTNELMVAGYRVEYYSISINTKKEKSITNDSQLNKDLPEVLLVNWNFIQPW